MEQREQMAVPADETGIVGNKRRRPTGAPPPLPKEIGYTGWLWLILVLAVVISGCLWLREDPGPLDAFDAKITSFVISLRTGWLDSFAPKAHTIGSRAGFGALAIALVAATAWFRRWRHLVIWMISLALAGSLLQGLELVAIRPRPFGVQQIASWEGFATPSIPIGAMAILWIGIAYMLVVPGRPRTWAKLAAAIVITLVGLLADLPGRRPLHRRRLRRDRRRRDPAGRVPCVRPNDIFPVSYGKHGKTAHLDVSGRRGEAIRAAMKDQLGFTVHEIKPVGLEGSGGLDASEDEHDRRGRPRANDLREALREEPRARRPLVQARALDALRQARGRDAVLDGSPVRRVRGLHAAHAR